MLNLVLEAVCVVCILALSVCIARFLSVTRLRPLAYLISFAILAAVISLRLIPALISISPFQLLAGRAGFVTLGISAALGLTAAASQLPRLQSRLALFAMISITFWVSAMPFITPVFLYNRFLNTQNTVNSKDICFQSSNYTCGPAAAVTALKKFDISANEGRIAIIARSNPITGTLPISLSNTINSEYAPLGLNSSIRFFDSVKQLQNAPAALAVIKDKRFSDHCVAILSVTENLVIFADPVLGRIVMSLSDFEKIWRFYAIIITQT